MNGHDFQAALNVRPRAVELEVFHLDMVTTTAVAIRPDQLETMSDIEKHQTHDTATIAAAFHAIDAAKPVASKQAREYRWKLVFFDAAHERILTVFTSHLHPYFGRIGERDVEFENDHLVLWLARTFAPKEVTALERAATLR